MCKASFVSIILLANRIIFGEFAANITFLHSQGYSHIVREALEPMGTTEPWGPSVSRVLHDV